MGEKTADAKKRFIECTHYYVDGDAEAYVHKHTVTLTPKPKGDDLEWICDHRIECRGRYDPVEKRKMDCAFNE
ncbi:MAG: hypothetical protein ACE5PM_02920 [Candidatus Hydrothermarchaeales archaeon]